MAWRAGLLYIQSLGVNSLSVRPVKGRTALASRCLRSPPFDEPTLVKRSRKLCGGRRDRGGEEEGGGGEEEGAGEEEL